MRRRALVLVLVLGIGIGRGQHNWVLDGLLGIVLTLFFTDSFRCVSLPRLTVKAYST